MPRPKKSSGLAKPSGAVMRTGWRGRWLRPRQATPVQPDSIGSWPFAEARIHTILTSVSRLGSIGPLLPVGGHGSSPLTLSANAGLGSRSLPSANGCGARSRCARRSNERSALHCHVTRRISQAWTGRARPDGRQGRPKPTSERDFMRRSPEPEEGGLQPPSILWAVAVLQAGTTATIFMSSGLTITTSSS